MSNHNKTSPLSNETDNSYELLAMPYNEFDITLKNIDKKELEKIGKAFGIEHLSDGKFCIPAFTVQGEILDL